MPALMDKEVGTPEVFIARQPIFGRAVDVVGYELLYRSSDSNIYAGDDADDSTMEILRHCLIDFGLNALAGTKRAFINFTEELIRDESATMLPPDRVVIEILPEVRPVPEIMAACIRLKERGYTLALDDYSASGEHGPLIDVADIIKVDFRSTCAEERERIGKWPRVAHARLLAKKVETVEEFRSSKEMGYSMFQGNFFSRPHVFSGRMVSPSEFACLDAFQELRKSEMDYDRVASIIKRDVSFTYSLLRYINSASVGVRVRIQSIRQALVLLGPKQTARWLSLVALRQLGKGRPSEVLAMCIVRGRMSELMACPAGLQDRATDMFLLGVFSGVDALLGRPVEEIAMELPLAHDVQEALSGELNPLARVFQLVLAYERGDWAAVTEIAHELGIEENVIVEAYLQAVAWATEFGHGSKSGATGTRSTGHRAGGDEARGTAD